MNASNEDKPDSDYCVLVLYTFHSFLTIESHKAYLAINTDHKDLIKNRLLECECYW